MTPNSTNFYDDIKITSVDVPSIRDVDHDNDLDILTFNIGGTTVEWYRNMSQENGVCDSLLFKLETSCWGEFTENTLNASITLNTPCSPPPIAHQDNNTRVEERHAGSCLECINTDGDTDEDLLIGDLTSQHIAYVRNGGTPLNALMNFTDATFPSYDTIVEMNIFACPYHLDINNDGIRDVLFSPNAPNTSANYTSNLLYLNTGANDSVVLAFDRNNFLQSEMIETGEGAVPRLFDYDNDGDLDLFIGNYGYYSSSGLYPSEIALYKNTGTFNNPSFTWVTNDFASLYADGYNILSPIPTFGDIDGDGDKDMIVGDLTGKLHFFRKDPGPTDNFVLAGANYQGIDVGNNAAPQLADVDRDGKLDLLIGEQAGNVNYYRNTGTNAAPVFTLTAPVFGGVIVQEPNYITGYSVPFLWDNNGNYTMLVGSERGFIYRYDNIDGNLTGSFTLTDSMYITTTEGMRIAPWMGNLNSDTLTDLIIGNYSGGVSVFFGDVLSSVQNNIQESIPSLNVYPNPAEATIRISGLNNNHGPFFTEIYSITGVLLKTVQMESAGQEIDVSTLAQGCYIGTVTDSEDIVATFRFIVAGTSKK